MTFSMIFLFLYGASAQVPVPHGISGIVFMSDGKTQAPTGTHFSVNDTTNSYRIEGNTGGPPGMSGRYSVPLSGEDGDEVILRAWNETHYGTRTVVLSGDMTGIDIVINTPRDNLNAVDITTQKKDQVSGGASGSSSPVENPANNEVKEKSRTTGQTLTPSATETTTIPVQEPLQKADGFEIFTALVTMIFAYSYWRKTGSGIYIRDCLCQFNFVFSINFDSLIYILMCGKFSGSSLYSHHYKNDILYHFM